MKSIFFRGKLRKRCPRVGGKHPFQRKAPEKMPSEAKKASFSEKSARKDAFGRGKSIFLNTKTSKKMPSNRRKVSFLKGELLILKRTEQDNGVSNFEGGKWDIPGDKVEMFETPGEAAVRETEEETGLKVAIKGIVFEHSNLGRRKNQVFTTLIYLCGYDNDSEITLNPIEHTEYKWVAPEDILEMGDKELVSYMKGLILAVNNK